MKWLVNIVQYALVLLIVIPVIYVWEKDRVERFCQQITPGMAQKHYLDKLSEAELKQRDQYSELEQEGGWQSTVTTYLPSEYQCQITGTASGVSSVKIVSKETKLHPL